MRTVSPVLSNLNHHFDAYQQKTGSTQVTIASELGVTQGCLSQYLNGHTPLNDSFLIRLCNLMRIDPAEIDEDFDNRTHQWQRYPKAQPMFGFDSPVGRYSYRPRNVECVRIYLDMPVVGLGPAGACVIATSIPFVPIKATRANAQPVYLYQKVHGWGHYRGDRDHHPEDAISEERWQVLEVHYA